MRTNREWENEPRTACVDLVFFFADPNVGCSRQKHYHTGETKKEKHGEMSNIT